MKAVVKINPESVNVAPEALTIVWPGAVKREYPAALLRQMCPCAKCVSEITGEILLDRASIPTDLKLVSADPVGHYGVTLGFSDHHATGIFAYSYLFEMPEAATASVSAPPKEGCGCGHSH